jgi:hypothetical protein
MMDSLIFAGVVIYFGLPILVVVIAIVAAVAIFMGELE